jgi:hypothetical protein
MAEKQWCPGCSREVEGVCHHFNCAIGPNGLDAQSRSSAATIAPLLPCPFCGNKPAIEDRDLAGKAKTIFCAEHDCIGPSTTAASYDDAAVQWNRRADAAQSPVVLGPTQEDAVAHAIMMDDGCGLTINGQRTLCDDPRAMEKPDRCYCRRSAKAALAALSAQPPAAPVETATKSAPVFIAPQNTAERPPSSDAAEAGADTRCSAGTTAPPMAESLRWEALESSGHNKRARAMFLAAAEEIERLRAVPQTAASPEISRLIAKSDEQTTALDQIMTTAADNLAAANSDLKMTLEFIHHVAEYTLAVTRPQHSSTGE